MEPFTFLESVALPLRQPNIDTDQIVPARFLRKPRSGGFGQFLFHDLRFNRDGSERPGFPMNQPLYRGAKIIVAARNFGCGSSREHAAWAIHDYGVRAIIVPSLGDIFAVNCLKNGVLTVVLPQETVTNILDVLSLTQEIRMEIDLENQTVRLPGGCSVGFDIDPFAKQCLRDGLDELAYTLSQIDRIVAFEHAMDVSAE